VSDERKRSALDDLAMLAQQRDEIESEIAKGVAHALNERAKWSEIEKALGLQRGTAQRRYGQLLIEERRWRLRDADDRG
jgi:hypothetical protein